MQVTCEDGFSLDGSPSGETSFEERCLEDGHLSHNHTCIDIDWCKVSKCDNHGRCKDESSTYTCSCDDGFEAVTDAVGQQSCVNGSKGMQASFLQCSWYPTNSFYTGSEELVSPEMVQIDCEQGFSVDQTRNPSSQSYAVCCNSDGVYENLQTCKPVKCGVARVVCYTTRLGDLSVALHARSLVAYLGRSESREYINDAAAELLALQTSKSRNDKIHRLSTSFKAVFA